jgi:hypothetical protein
MISTSDGSRPSAEEFLLSKLRQYDLQEDMIARMQREQMPTLYQEVAGGQVRNDVRSKATAGILKI